MQPAIASALAADIQRRAQQRATGHDYHNSCHANREAVTIALDALRKIALNHPCDLHDRIAADAVARIETLVPLRKGHADG